MTKKRLMNTLHYFRTEYNNLLTTFAKYMESSIELGYIEKNDNHISPIGVCDYFYSIDEVYTILTNKIPPDTVRAYKDYELECMEKGIDRECNVYSFKKIKGK